jgi:hypothetical protein
MNDGYNRHAMFRPGTRAIQVREGVSRVDVPPSPVAPAVHCPANHGAVAVAEEGCKSRRNLNKSNPDPMRCIGRKCQRFLEAERRSTSVSSKWITVKDGMVFYNRRPAGVCPDCAERGVTRNISPGATTCRACRWERKRRENS